MFTLQILNYYVYRKKNSMSCEIKEESLCYAKMTNIVQIPLDVDIYSVDINSSIDIDIIDIRCAVNANRQT